MPEGPRDLKLPEPGFLTELVVDSASRFVFAVEGDGRAYVAPLDGSPVRRLEGFGPDTMLLAAAISPSGRFVATAWGFGGGEKSLRVWDLTSGAVRRLDLPLSANRPGDRGDTRGSAVYDGSITSLAFLGDSVLLSAGNGGIRRFELDGGGQKILFKLAPGLTANARFDGNGRTALIRRWRSASEQICVTSELADLGTGRAHPLASFGSCGIDTAMGLDPTGTIVVTGDRDGLVRVGRPGRGEPHILAGHTAPVQFVAISPNLRWVASSSEDNTLRLWPMPDLDQPPVHTLPHDELIAKLKSLTNFRAVRDPAAPSGWKIEIGPFPGWKNVPTW
jgi:WD40 repeat protein